MCFWDHLSICITMNIIPGIYKIVNITNGKMYIGSSKNMMRRWKQHTSLLNNNHHHSVHLQRAWNKYGKENFMYEILKEMPTASDVELLDEERRFVESLKPEYNVGGIGGGDNLTNNPNRELIIEKITKSIRDRNARMTDQDKLEKWSRPGEKNPNWKGGISIKYCKDCGDEIDYGSLRCMACSKIGSQNPFYGKSHTEETKTLLSQLHTGKIMSSETKEKCKQASINFYNSEDGIRYKEEFSKRISGKNHPLYGIGHTEESCKKISKSKIDKLANMSIEERYRWNKMRKVRVVRIKTDYYFSLTEALLFYIKSAMSLRFRCCSVDKKWDDYEFIDIRTYNESQDNEMINKIKNTSITQQRHT